MSELFVELFSEEIPARLQINARNELKKKIGSTSDEGNYASDYFSRPGITGKGDGQRLVRKV